MNRKSKVFLGSAALLGFTILGGLTSSAFAATITVDSTEPNTVVGDCTFEDAIRAHETSLAVEGCTAGTGGTADDTIVLPNSSTAIKVSATVEITKGRLTIQGDSVDKSILDGDSTKQILNIDADGLVTIKDVTIQNGKAAANGGAVVAASNLTVDRVLFRNNEAQTGFSGGALYVSGVTGTPTTLTVTNSTFDSNKSSLFGGAVALVIADASLTNVTFSGNLSADSSSHAVDVDDASLDLMNSTFGEQQKRPLIRSNTDGTVTIKNSIIGGYSDEDAPSCFGAGTITSNGYNLMSSNNGCTPIMSDVVANNLYLGELSSVTNSIPTISPLKNSGAINLADPATCPATDAREVTRNLPTDCDAGAYELDRAAVPGLYRFLSKESGEHLYTRDTDEIAFLKTSEYGIANWIYEGLAFPVDEATTGSNLGVHRLRNTTTGLHHFTSDANEVTVITQLGWEDEGIKFYANPVQGNGGNANFTDVHRFFNVVNGQHLFTKDLNEIEFLQTSPYGQANWDDEEFVFSSSFTN